MKIDSVISGAGSRDLLLARSASAAGEQQVPARAVRHASLGERLGRDDATLSQRSSEPTNAQTY